MDHDWITEAVVEATSTTGQRPWRGTRRPMRTSLWSFVMAFVYVLAVAAVAADVFIWRP